MSDIFQEVQEEYRREQLAKMWDQYRVPIIAAAVGMLLAVAAYQLWTYLHNRAVEASSRQFEALSTSLEQQQQQPAQQRATAAALARLADDGAGGYPFVARLQEAAVRGAVGDTKAAVTLYDRIADSTSDPLFAGYAHLRAAILLVETAPLADIKKRLDPIAASDSPWRVEAEEFLAYANWRAGDSKEALRLYDLIKNNPAATPGVKQRATEFYSMINGGMKLADLKTAPTLAPTPASQLPTIPGMPTFDTPEIPAPDASETPTAPTPTP
ncbi:MAG: tetratricopeptide repeat protein [Alphaproteobacteria bacterium]|nr:tetratricopeptide repeat protein [Alphaproteobacteria bacterium]